MLPAIGLPLPNVERAIIDRRKLEDYALDAAHKDGRHKARVFVRNAAEGATGSIIATLG